MAQNQPGTPGDSAAAQSPGEMSDEQYNAIAVGTKPQEETEQPDPAQPGWGARIGRFMRSVLGGSLKENASAAVSAAGGTAKDLSKDVAYGATDAANAISNAAVGTGQFIADKTGLGPAVVGDEAWHDYYSQHTADTNPLQFGDDFRRDHFGAAPKGAANSLVRGVADFAATSVATAGAGELAEGGKLGELAAKLPKFWTKTLAIGGTQALGTDPRAERLSSMAKNVPVFGPAISLLATKPTDSDAVASAKNVFENILTAATFEGFASKFGAKAAEEAPVALRTERPDVVNVVDRGNGRAELQPKSELPPETDEERARNQAQRDVVSQQPRMLMKQSSNGGEHLYTAEHNGTKYTLNVTEQDGGKTLKANVAPAASADLEAGFDENKTFDPTAPDESQKGPNEVGPRMVRQALSELSQDFPNAERVAGLRVSGARTGSAGSGASEGSFDLSRFREKANPVGPRPEIESLGASMNEAASQHAMEPGKLTDLQQAKVADFAERVKQIGKKATPQDITRLARGTVFNFNYVHGPESVKAALEATADALHNTGVVTTQTHEQTVAMAHGLLDGMDGDQAASSIGGWLKGATAGLSSKVLAARMVLHDMARQASQLSINADEFPHNTVAHENLSRVLDSLFDLHENLSGASTEVARTLEAHKIPVGGLTQNLDGADAVAGADEHATNVNAQANAAATADANSPTRGGKAGEGLAPSDFSAGNASQGKAAEYIKSKRPEGVSKTAPVTPKELRDLARSVRLSQGDPDAILAAVRSTRRIAEASTQDLNPTGMKRVVQAAQTFRMASMLAGPKTAATIVFNQAATMVMTPIERMWAGVRSGNAELRQQGWDQLVGLSEGFNESMSAAKRAWDIGNNVIDPQAHALDTGPAPLGKSWLGRLANVPSRFHIAANEFFKQMNYRSAVRSMSLRASAESGADAAMTTARLQGDMRYAFDLNGGAVNPAALQYAREATFTNPLEGGIGKWLQDGANQHPLIKLVVPFVRTPTNIFRYAWQRTPLLGRFQSQMASDLAAGGERAAIANAKQEFGAVAYGLAAYWAASGRITGKGPTDPELRAQWLAAGNQPYSMRFGNTWVSYRRADPMGAPLGLVADAVGGTAGITNKLQRQVHEDRVDDDGVYHPSVSFMQDVADYTMASGHLMSNEGEQIAASLIGSVASNLSSKTYMQGMVEFFDAMGNGDHKSVKSFIDGTAGTFVPNILNQMNPDNTKRETRNIVQSVMARVPGLSTTLEPKRNIFGEKIMYPAGFLDYANRAVNPFIAMQHDPKVDDDLIQLGKGMAMPAEKVKANDGMNEVDLTDRDSYREKDAPRQSPYDRMLELMAKPADGSPSLRDAMSELVQSDDWQNADPSMGPGGERYIMAQKLIQQYQKDAMDQVREEYPKLDDALNGIRSLRGVAKRGAQDDVDEAFAQFRAAHR